MSMKEEVQLDWFSIHYCSDLRWWAPSTDQVHLECDFNWQVLVRPSGAMAWWWRELFTKIHDLLFWTGVTARRWILFYIPKCSLYLCVVWDQYGKWLLFIKRMWADVNCIKGWDFKEIRGLSPHYSFPIPRLNKEEFFDPRGSWSHKMEVT